MPKTEKPGEGVDWNLTTWDGSRREALRRWAKLPLERVIAALEEMRELSDMLAKSHAADEAASASAAESAVREPRDGDNAKTGTPSVSPRNAAPDGHHESQQPNKQGGHER